MSSSSTPSRRTLVKGAAWSVPVVAMTAKVSAADVVCSPNNTSPECNPVTPPTSRPGEACKFSGGSCSPWKHAYRFVFCMTNHGDEPIQVNFTNLYVNGKNNTPSPTSVSVPADGREHCYYVLVDQQGNSANGQGTLSWNYTWVDEFGRDRYVEGTSPTGVNDLPPCDDCSTTYGVQGAPAIEKRSALEEELVEDEPTTEDAPESEAPAEEQTESTTPEQPGDDAATTGGPTS